MDTAMAYGANASDHKESQEQSHSSLDMLVNPYGCRLDGEQDYIRYLFAVDHMDGQSPKVALKDNTLGE